MKLTMKLLLPLIAGSLLILTGCAGRITPLTAQNLTTLAVYEAGKDKDRAAFMRRVQPPACAIATLQGATIEDVIGEVINATDASPEDKIVLNIILSIFQTSTAPQGTNVVAQSPYLKAVFCDGWANGLELLPPSGGSKIIARNAPPKASRKLPGKWIMVK